MDVYCLWYKMFEDSLWYDDVEFPTFYYSVDLQENNNLNFQKRTSTFVKKRRSMLKHKKNKLYNKNYKKVKRSSKKFYRRK